MKDPAGYKKDAPLSTDLGKFILDKFSALNPGERKTVLEIGCGTGEIAVELRKRGYQIVATDVSEEMVAKTKETFVKALGEASAYDKTITTLVCAAQDIGDQFSENSFDAVISNSTFHWLNADQLKSCLAGVSKVLKSDGKFVNANASASLDKSTPSMFQSLLRAIEQCGIPVQNNFHYINSETFKSALDEAGLNTGTIGIEICSSPLSSGPEGWMKTFAPYHFDKEKHPQDLSEKELESVSKAGGKIYREWCDKYKEECKGLDRNPSIASYPRHTICVTLSQEMKREKESSQVKRQKAINPDSIQEDIIKSKERSPS